MYDLHGKNVWCIIIDMNIQSHILRSIRLRRGGFLLRSDIAELGSDSQISTALRQLCREGLIQRVDRGIYATPQKLALLGEEVILERALQRQVKLRKKLETGHKRGPVTPTARYVGNLAKRLGIAYSAIYPDLWAASVTRLAGDEVISDATDDLLVALTRAGKLTPSEMVKLTMQHHRTLKSHV